jgi:hypothetical protein
VWVWVGGCGGGNGSQYPSYYIRADGKDLRSHPTTRATHHPPNYTYEVARSSKRASVRACRAHQKEGVGRTKVILHEVLDGFAEIGEFWHDEKRVCCGAGIVKTRQGQCKVSGTEGVRDRLGTSTAGYTVHSPGLLMQRSASKAKRVLLKRVSTAAASQDIGAQSTNFAPRMQPGLDSNSRASQQRAFQPLACGVRVCVCWGVGGTAQQHHRLQETTTSPTSPRHPTSTMRWKRIQAHHTHMRIRWTHDQNRAHRWGYRCTVVVSCVLRVLIEVVAGKRGEECTPVAACYTAGHEPPPLPPC